MTDLLIPYLISMSVSLFLLGATAFLLFELRRRIETFKEHESRLPDACRLPGLTAEVSRLTEERNAFQKDIDNARSVIARQKAVEQWLDQNLVTYERASRELPALRAEFESLTKQRDTVRDQCEQLREESRQLHQDTAPYRLLIERKQQAEKWLNENQARYEKVQRELPLLNDQFESLQASLIDLRRERDEIVLEEKQAEHQHKWLLDENQRLNGVIGGQVAEQRKMNKEFGELQAKQAGLLALIEQLQVKRDDAEGRLKDAESLVTQAKATVEKLVDQVEEIESDRAVKLEVVQALDRLKKQLESEKKRLDDEIENTKARLEAELEQINDLIAAAVHRWEQIAPTVGISDENKLAELWSPALSRQQFSVESGNDEQACLEQTARHLSDLGLRFDKRVLNAFHTSLKVAEMSPLVVLAGISGTGKSELPRRYAEGMGMHSLTLAVQPRWDSPQDMFGFYNYLENRYRATELARALVQMDSFFNEEGRNWCFPDGWERNNLSDRMLLVLLDEMNLARVEYYFSEFLSRLETRRGIDRRSPLERRKAEIALEVGMQSLSRNNGQVNVQQQPTLQLFVDTNVLFVGTMNEDESTQTLSDKVVDRANVLRFGRPTKLASRTPDNLAKPSESWLPYKTWRRWIRSEDTLPTNVHEEVSQWGQKLNQAMQSIGRPFAHRTFASMLAYVANYPDPDAFKLAMADQVELKLLPKFRGLDPQDAGVRRSLDEVKKVLNELGDEKLQKAVEEAAKGGDHQFVWHGVDRLENT